MFLLSCLLVSSVKDLCENVEAQNIIETGCFISNFNVFILMFVIYFLSASLYFSKRGAY